MPFTITAWEDQTDDIYYNWQVRISGKDIEETQLSEEEKFLILTANSKDSSFSYKLLCLALLAWKLEQRSPKE